MLWIKVNPLFARMTSNVKLRGSPASGRVPLERRVRHKPAPRKSLQAAIKQKAERRRDNLDENFREKKTAHVLVVVETEATLYGKLGKKILICCFAKPQWCVQYVEKMHRTVNI